MGAEALSLDALADIETPWALRVAVTLRIAEHIATGESDLAALATLARCDADALGRVLRRLVSKGVFESPAPGRFALNEAARVLLDPGVRAGLDLDGIGGRMAGAWASLLSVVRTGRPAYDEVFGRPFWEDLAANPVIAASFDELMGPTGHGAPSADVLLDGDWSAIHTVVDVGGGTGALLAEVLHAHPGVRGTLVDLPSVVAKSSPLFDAAGVTDRVATIGQSFFEPLPAGADLYLLKSVLGDWPDADALRILKCCAEAMGPADRLATFDAGPDDAAGASPELLMLVLVGGKGRTLSEFRELAASAGLRVTRAGRNAAGRHIVECRTL